MHAIFRKKGNDMIAPNVACRGKQRWVASNCTVNTSILFMIATLIGLLNPTAAVYAANRPSSYILNKLCTNAIFCDNFENQLGLTPSGAWTVSYPRCQGTGTVTVDRTIAHSGRTSMRINGRTGYCNHVFISLKNAFFGLGSLQNAFFGLGTDVHVRFFVRHTTALSPNHVAFVAMKDIHDGGKDLRMGGQNSKLQWNRESDDATLPVQSPVGTALSMPLPPNQWECVEFEIKEAPKTMNTFMNTWLNTTLVQGLTLDNVPTQDVDSQWLSNHPNWRPALVDLRLGWESYAGNEDTLWFDDVAIGLKPLGCG